jgi:RHS repeat-associated protein
MDQFRVVAELDGSNNLVSRFVHTTEGGTTPDYMTRGGVTYRIISDTLGSVRLVVDAATGAIAQRLDYDEFGVVIMDTNPGFQPFGFAGGLYEPQTKLIRFGARDYDAQTGRWTTKDPTLFAGGDTNLYAYASNDPVNGSDAEGKKNNNGNAGAEVNFTNYLKDALTPEQDQQFLNDPKNRNQDTGSEIARLNQQALDQQNKIAKLNMELEELKRQRCPDKERIQKLMNKIRRKEENLAKTKADINFLIKYISRHGTRAVEDYIDDEDY